MRRKKAAYLTEYLNNYHVLDQRFRVGRCMYGDYKTDINFAVVQGMLLW